MTTRDRELLGASGLVMLITILVVGAILIGASGCKAMQFGKAGIATEIAQAQAPGEATGAGATLRGPTNSATPSTQVSERRTAYYRPRMDLAATRYGQSATGNRNPETIEASNSPMTAVPEVNAGATNEPEIPMPAWTYERTETNLGAHQNVSAIMQAAAKLDGLNKIQWLGVLCLLFCYSGLLYCMGHNEGYPVICWKLGAIGMFFLIFCENPWWAALLLFPLGFYAVQKLGLLKLPVL